MIEICNNYPVDYIDSDFFTNRNDIHILYFNNNCGIKTIKAHAFKNCENIERIIFNDDLVHIDDEAFMNCRKLKEIVFPKNVNFIGTSAFADCINL